MNAEKVSVLASCLPAGHRMGQDSSTSDPQPSTVSLYHKDLTLYHHIINTKTNFTMARTCHFL